MWQDENLKSHIETSTTLKTSTVVIAEWNMNTPDNIHLLGNYRNRVKPRGVDDADYKDLISYFDETDSANFYTDATNADIKFDGGFDDDDVPQIFKVNNDKMKQLFSLEDCIKPFRPRSGINKAMYFAGSNFNNFSTAALTQSDNSSVSTIDRASYNFVQRPRYYPPTREDLFKYWTSYRVEDGIERGISNIVKDGINYIDDAVPFVVYKTPVFANRLVVKMQTNTGSVNLGPFISNGVSVADPLYGASKRTVPLNWKIQVLRDSNVWTTVKEFNANSTRADGSSIVGDDGHVELSYGLKIPAQFKDSFRFIKKIRSSSLRPETATHGDAWLITDGKTRGTLSIWNENVKNFEDSAPQYTWELSADRLYNDTHFVTSLVNPEFFTENDKTVYRQLDLFRGIRIVADTMNRVDSTFDLIEMSPRLSINISDYTTGFSIKKTLADLNDISVPVGQLLASTGSIEIMDDEKAFNPNNSNSLVGKYLSNNVKFVMYDGIRDVPETIDGITTEIDYYIPLKTLYSASIPKVDVSTGKVSVELRDFYFYLESNTAPELLLRDISLSYAVSILLDNIGFSNYVFKRIGEETDPIIPFFFVAPNQTVAEVLNQLAQATQTAMFFDEYNNFIVMSKNYITALEDERTTATALTSNYANGIQPNILEIAANDKKIFNNGRINYTERYIQRSYGSIKQSTMIDADKTWIYKPVELWQASGTEVTKTINSQVAMMSDYTLGAYPLTDSITVEPPKVVNHLLVNNIINLGEGVFFLTRYQGYLYANGEIIRYDAAQFSVPGYGNVWISSNEEYQKYFSNLVFNGKIYPTGLIRIYSEPYYETVNGITMMKNGAVSKHGRGQFGTDITSHPAGLSSYWSANENVRGCTMDASLLFTTEDVINYPATSIGEAGLDNARALKSFRTGIIRNLLSTNYRTETEVNKLKSVQAGTLQSSALVMTGPTFDVGEKALNSISYVYKNLKSPTTPVDGIISAATADYKHFGTRMRIIGKIEVGDQRSQTPLGSMPYYTAPGSVASQSLTISGGGGGISVLLNPKTNVGYYFELSALTEKNIQDYMTLDAAGNPVNMISNVLFYKIVQKTGTTEAVPVKLWGGQTNVAVDNGKFTGQYRTTGESNPTVYDLSVEYRDISSTHRKFYLYIDNNLVKVVDDFEPLPAYNNVALFVRGTSRVMFENVYALSDNYSNNTMFPSTKVIADAFGDKEINATEALRKYAVSGFVQAAYLSEISAQKPTGYKMYFEEFGTILREAAYFNIKYDKAWPALYAKLSPSFNKMKSYVTSGFMANAYGAEFLVFNATDTVLPMDEQTGNYLKIQGVTFTQDTTHELSVDKFLEKRSDFSDPELKGTRVLRSPEIFEEKFNEIKLSRMTHGNNDFTIESQYIQTQDQAEGLMDWIINRIMKPKKTIGVKIFSNPMLQLGDIVTLEYSRDGIDLLGSSGDRFIIYSIEYSKGVGGPDMTVYLCEI